MANVMILMTLYHNDTELDSKEGQRRGCYDEHTFDDVVMMTITIG